MEHRPHPILVGNDIGEHSDIPFAVDIDAKGVRTLPGLLVEVATADHVFDGESDPGVESPTKLQDIGLGIGHVEVGLEDGRGFLEERIVIVPGAKIGLVQPEASELGVDLPL